MTSGETKATAQQVKLNDFERTWEEVGSQALAAFSTVGRSGWYILGQQVQGFEQDLATFSQLSHAIGCANGLDAIEIGLRALDLQSGQKVLTTPLSAFATTLAIVRAGGTPIYVDVDLDGQLDLDQAEAALQADPEIRTMVPVHLYGRALDLPKLANLRDQHNLRIVEDMAQSLGASWRGQPVGSVGQVAAVSFYPTKNLGCFGDGGAVLCGDPAIDQRCRSLRDYGQTSKYVHAELGLNSRLDEVQAAILKEALLPKLQGWTKRRREIARAYAQGIHHASIALPTPSDDSVWHLYVLRCPQRDALMAHLHAQDVQSGVHYPGLITDQKAMRGFIQPPPLPIARELTRTVLSLPIHPYLTDNEVARVIDGVNSWVPA